MTPIRIFIAIATAVFCGISAAEPVVISLTRFDGPAPTFREESGIYQIEGPM